jgi:cell division protein FtsL
MKKLETLDLIKDRILSVEQDVKSLKESINFAHAELDDLKKEMKERKEAEDEREMKDQNLRRI